MQPIAPLLIAQETSPNVELLRRHGWSVNCISGSYCTAWRGLSEVTFAWRDGSWQRVGGRGGAEDF
jgi:hypothetical protein